MTDENTQDAASRLRALADEWWQPPADLIATLPKGGVQLSYLGHADTTRALIECDPEWSWIPMATDERGLPVLDCDEQGRPVGMWIWITVCGVERPAYGSCEPGKRDAVKELIGDALRNGAMRFGVAGGLWSKADRDAPPKATRRKATRPRTANTDMPMDTTDLPDPPAGTAEFQALALLAPEASAAAIAGTLKAAGIADRASLTDAATFDKAQAAIVAKYGKGNA